MYRLVEAHPQGTIVEAALREYFSRAGIENQRARLEETAAALVRRGICRSTSRAAIARVELLVTEGIHAYGRVLRERG